MKCKALETIQRHQLLTPGAAVIAAVSGGADSMALLYLLDELRAELSLRLSAAHINHGLRGAEADRDESLVREACARLGVPLHVLHADVAREAKRTGEGIEACGRRVRYAYLESLDETARIATAHTLDDQLETFLMHFARGSGLRGLCGIPAERGRIVRPLIDCTREEIEAYCAQRQIAFATDSTNLSRAYVRNRVRLDIVPVLRAINPNVHEAARRCMETLSADERLLERQAAQAAAVKKGNGYDAAHLLSLPQALRARVLAALLAENGCDSPEYRHIAAAEALLEQGYGRAQLGGGAAVRVRHGVLEFLRETAGFQVEAEPFLVLPEQWPAAQVCAMGEETLSFSFVYKKDFVKIQKIHKHQLANCLDYDRIHGKLILRQRSAGDRLRPAGRGCTKTFKNLFQEWEVPPEKRGSMPVLGDAAGPVWALFFGADERVRITDETQKILIINCGGQA